MFKSKTVCQSCGSPLRKDSDKGRERNGVITETYCRRCYQLGGFTDLQMTVEKMHEIIRLKMTELRFPRFLADKLADNVYKLKRWANPLQEDVKSFSNISR
jgi:hypothetical protein